MGIGGFLDDLGNAIDKINKWTSLAPGGFEDKPLGSISGKGVSFNNPFSDRVKAPSEGGGVFASTVLNSGLEHTMSGMRWLYSNGVSHPIATAALVGKMNRGNNSFWGGDYFNSSSWDKAWKASTHISPGQAMLMNPDEAKQAIESPLLYYKPAEAYLPPGFNKLPQSQQQEILKEAGMPAVGNAYIEKMRGHSAWFKYGSGAIDFSSVMFLDPTATALNVAGKARALAVVKKAPKGGWSEAQIDELMNSNKMSTMMAGIWANKDNPQLLNNTALAQHSGMGPRFGSVVSRLADEEELHLFMRIGMGDGRAIEELKLRNADAAHRLTSNETRLAGLDLMRSRYSNFPNVQAMVDSEMERVATARSADADLVNRYDDILANENLIDQLHVSRWSMARAEDRTLAQNQYVVGPARGGLVRGQSRGVTIRPSRGPVSSTSYVPPEVESGIVHTRLWGAGDFFTGPVTMIRSLKNAHPNGYMAIDSIDKDSVNELRGHLARIPGIKESTRANIINQYLKTTTEHQRKDILEDVGRLGAAKVAQKYGLDADLGMEIYRKTLKLKQGEVDRMQRYTAALDPERTNAAGQPLHLDELTDTGGKTVLTPFTASRLMNGHTFQDLDAMAKALSRHGDKLMTLKRAMGNSRDAVENWMDYSSYLWKFTTLFRLGYVPRVLGDDLGSQWASVGTAAMVLRGAKGVKNAFDNASRWIAKPALQAREANALEGAKYAHDEAMMIRPQVTKLKGVLQADLAQRQHEVVVAGTRHRAAQAKLAQLNPEDRSPKALAVRNFASQRAAQLKAAEARHAAGTSPGKQAELIRLTDRHDTLLRYRDLQNRAAEDYRQQYQKVVQGNQPVTIDGEIWPGAFGGKSGEYAHAQISADQSVGNIFATNKQILQANLERSFDHGAKPISAKQDEAAHAGAWAHAINNQIMQDPLSKMAVQGKSIEEMTKWMQEDARGMRYRARLPKNLFTEDIARSAKYEVDQYLHTPEIRMKALEPDGVNPAWLKKAVPLAADRPDVHIGQVGQSQLQHAHALDRVISKFYHVAATIPANRMSRHPLFNQLYEGHRDRIIAQQKLQFAERYGKDVVMPKRSVAEIEHLAHSARQLALRDTRQLVFDIAHRSDAAAAMRFISPFFSATAEAFQRWGRVIADKPQIVGYAANWYNSPAYLGKVQDMDGNHVDQYGYTYIPQYPLKADGRPDYSKKPTVIKRMVPKSERYIITRLPKWVVDSPLGAALNVRESNGGLLLSQNSIDMVTQGDPWFNPGVGPIVQIPVNEYVKDKPRAAELARHLSILPFGVQGGTLFGENPFGRAMSIATPTQIRNFITSYDTSDQRYQQVKMQIMNRAIYEHDVLGKPMPTAKQIADRTHDYWKFAAAASFLQPFATQRKDPYQFYYDQYNALRRQNPLTADDEFLKRFEESRFIFASEITKSSGIPPTNKAVELVRKYGEMISKNPDLAPLIIGPEGNGPFSPEAYRYELNNPLVPGGAEMMRTKMTAEEALSENRRRLGWAKYTKRMNSLTADLHKAGFTSFDDEGAEDFKDEKRAWTSLYSEPLYPDGTPNPYYNEAWSKDFFTQDDRKYERLIPAMTTLARSELANQPQRSDLRKLQIYLGGRQALVQELQDRKASGLPYTLAAQENEDLRYQWSTFVGGLIEESPRFGDLYHRYLSRDMGIDAQEEEVQRNA